MMLRYNVFRHLRRARSAAGRAGDRAPSGQLGRVAFAVCALVITAAGATDAEPASGTASDARVVESAETGFDSATRHDSEFNRLFRHEFADVGGMRMHYVTGGTGPALVLLHGWPQSWYEWRGIMPALAQRFTVYAVDLPGLGDSQGAPRSYDKATLARVVHALIGERLGLRVIRLVCHALGAGVGFQ